MKRVKFLLLLTLLGQPLSAFAISAIRISYGDGTPDQMRGVRVALQWNWGKRFYSLSRWAYISGFWDTSIAYWHVRPQVSFQPSHLLSFAASPILTLVKTQPWHHLQPYVEAGLGIAKLSKQNLGHRRFGSTFAFQDTFGIGLRFGPREQFDVSYHYLHYSNAGLFPPNEGIDVSQLVSLRYHFK